MGEHTNYLSKIVMERDHFGDLGTNGRKDIRRDGVDRIQGYNLAMGCCKQGDESIQDA
jgi:hypothetical protein